MGLFNNIISRPFGWVLYQLFELVGSYGVALILFTVFSKIIMLPFQMKSKKGMMEMQRIQPKLKELEKKYKDDKEKYAIAVQKLYKDEGVSMMGGCLPLLITIPIMIGLYQVVRQPLTFMFSLSGDAIRQIAGIVNVPIEGSNLSTLEIEIASKMGAFKDQLAGIIGNIRTIDFNFLGMNLARTPNFSFEAGNLIENWILSGATSFLYSWTAKKYQPAAADTQAGLGMMTYLMPLMSVYIAFLVPAGLGFYWIVNNILMTLQEPALNRYYTRKKEKDNNPTGGS
jgi:YidC/Oxa1 family membrane protein insertase